ncbi:preprotein translocase subunit YajC [Aestuariispira ectoiniformans]|uniref:preprotein translocase subunit YajC n=1 Tax=Aestuariispira ectoiniformans TaxID=2775080 RepID=UPI0021E40172|nr:preprotein translocase subunit YajC [Aestuariispira ectoiniformans]
MFISEAWAQTAGAAGGGSLLTSMLPLALIFVVFYFLLIRPQQKKQKDHQNKLSSIRRGDKILTGGGFYGTVTKVIDDNELQVELAEGVKVRVAKQTVMDVLTKTEPANDTTAAQEKKGGLAGLFGGKKDK